MKKKALFKSIFKEIIQNKVRFLSILGIILLGTSFYAGISAIGPNMKKTVNEYAINNNFMDAQVFSTYGLVDKDVKLLEKDDNVLEYETSLFRDVNQSDNITVVRFYAYNHSKPNKINKYSIVEGRFPKNKDEIVIDYKMKEFSDFKLNETREFMVDENETKDLKIVGFVNSPAYLNYHMRDNTLVGNGSVEYFALLDESYFDDDEIYSQLNIKYKNVQGLETYSQEYEDIMDDNITDLELLFKERTDQRLSEIKEDGLNKIKDAKAKIKKNEKKLEDAKKKLDDAQGQIADGNSELIKNENAFKEEMKKAEAEIAQAKKELKASEKQLENAPNEFKKAKQQLDHAKNQLLANGLDPQQDVSILKQNVKDLTSATTNLTNMISSMETALNNNDLSEVQVDAWISAAQQLNLSALENSLINLKNDLTNENLITSLNIAQASNKEIKSNITNLELAIDSISQYQNGLKQYEKNLAEYNSGVLQQKLADGKKLIAENEQKLLDGKKKANEEFAKARQKLKNAQLEYEKGLSEYQEGMIKLDEAKTKITKNEKKLNNLKDAEYNFHTRQDNSGFIDYKENSQRISSIATIFPVFFFMIAALVTLTTMTRMVDEKRSEIGLMKALGYSNFEISLKYIIYGSLAAIIGAGLGVIIGFYLFPSVVIGAYKSMYALIDINIAFYSNLIIHSFVVALICTIVSALVVLRVDLLSNPAKLMLAKAPKKGQRIFLERITPIWKRLNFMHKVTARNLFRYKVRMLMTIIGVAGCMALILTGFGVKDSISNLSNLQFEKVWKHQAIITFDSDANQEDSDDYNKFIKNYKYYEDSLDVAYNNFTIKMNGEKEQSVAVNTLSSIENVDKYILFNNRITNEKYILDDHGVFISEKLANIYGIQENDVISISNGDNKTYQMKVSHIVENYLTHQIYLSASYHEEVFSKKPVYESQFLLLKGNYDKNEVANAIMANDKVVNVNTLEDSNTIMKGSLDSLNIVIWVLIVSAGLLAFIVLYNLININIAERIRELSTIKVLGFYDREVSMYIFRENIILTILGIIAGFGVGIFLHRFVLATAEVDQAMFAPVIHFQSYVYAAIITMLFAIIVMLFMHKRIAKINMIDALKSYE